MVLVGLLPSDRSACGPEPQLNPPFHLLHSILHEWGLGLCSWPYYSVWLSCVVCYQHFVTSCVWENLFPVCLAVKQYVAGHLPHLI